MADQTRLATAISEISRNALRYGGGGHCEIVSVDLEIHSFPLEASTLRPNAFEAA